jgi:anaerobic selenocysteine-containing dehydrogenase
MDEIRQYEGGHVWEIEEPRYGFILPDMIGHPDKRMALAHPAVMDELRQVLAEPVIAGGGYQAGEDLAFRLVNYRMKEAYCTQGQNLPTLHRRAARNPLLMNPVDMQRIGVHGGDTVTVDSKFGSLQATVEASEDVAAGVVAMAYGWGDLSAGKSAGVNVQRIIPDDYRFDPVSGMALQTAIPVNVMAAAT